jgi:serine/threonine protein kinase
MSENFPAEADAPPPDSLTLSRLGHYHLEERIGAGGMAVVFRARDERLQRRVALKVLAPTLAGDEAFRHRFIRESQAAAAVDDPHIIPVFEAGEAEGVLFLAMRYVPGGDVRTLIRRAGLCSSTQALAIISSVASALDAAHSAGLVHRDVKPANILLDVRPGRPDHVYLSDFGLSKMVMSSLGPTREGQFLGTPGYSAPEQLEGKQVDARADQYSLACATFELLCGQTPFPRDQVAAVIWAHISEPPPTLTSQRPSLPPAVDGVLAKALAKVPADRYASCRAFAEALRDALSLAPYNPRSGVSPQADDSSVESAMSDGSGAAQRNILATEAIAETVDDPRAREAARSNTSLEATVSWHEKQHEDPGVLAGQLLRPATPTSAPSDSSRWTATTGRPPLHSDDSHRAWPVLRRLGRNRLRAVLVALIVLAALGSVGGYFINVYGSSHTGKSDRAGGTGTTDSHRKSTGKSTRNAAGPKATPTVTPTISPAMAGSWAGTLSQHSPSGAFSVNARITLIVGSRSGIVTYSGPFSCSDSLQLLASSATTLTMAQEVVSGPCQPGTLTLQQGANNTIEVAFRGRGAPAATGTLGQVPERAVFRA